MTRFLKRHVFSLCAAVLTLWSFYGWFQSSRNWTSYNLETSMGIVRCACESSMFMIAALEINHEQRLKFWKESDPIDGDRMTFIWAMPKFETSGGIFGVLLPFWQVVLFFLAIAAALFWWERRRIARGRA